eukprot:NODE_9508_length_338_cov_198.201413.p5 GENE.NODE_9508_length_338_cov_198.201413~~NODE_9508_length_338_cov_198.201413.p5  ORF type:complete len:55 (-),score=7.62 NODE_9508_length_338_cov_198.201413:71-235(-)
MLDPRRWHAVLCEEDDPFGGLAVSARDSASNAMAAELVRHARSPSLENRQLLAT